MTSEERLKEHLEKETIFQTHLTLFSRNMELEHERNGAGLKNEFKMSILNRIETLKPEEKISLVLVDIQNDFVYREGALYVNGGENTVISNMSLLDAVTEIIAENLILARQIVIITTQDAHVLDRSLDTQDSQAMEKSLPGWKERVRQEQLELEPFDPVSGKYDLHCLRGTAGAAIAEPIARRINHLRSQVEVYSYGKITFSAPESGMRLDDRLDLSEERFIDQKKPIYQDPPQSFLEFAMKQTIKEFLLTGICANICLKAAAAFLGKMAIVLDAGTHFLIPPGSSYEREREKLESELKEKGVRFLDFEGYRSNPEQICTIMRKETYGFYSRFFQRADKKMAATSAAESSHDSSRGYSAAS